MAAIPRNSPCRACTPRRGPFQIVVLVAWHTGIFQLALVVLLDFALDILVLPAIIWRMKDKAMHVGKRSRGDVGSLNEVTHCRKFTLKYLGHFFPCTSFVQARISENLPQDVSSQGGCNNQYLRELPKAWGTDT